jgi:hypothetical protein
MLLPSFPCLKCGIILPENLITVDHHHPQSIGEIDALLKVFRACSMTKGEPAGALGQFYKEYVSRSVNDLVSAIVKPELWPTVVFPYIKNTSHASNSDRHTLNCYGTILYSALIYSKDIKQMKHICMSSFLNLKPMCLSCNASKGNSSK